MKTQFARTTRPAPRIGAGAAQRDPLNGGAAWWIRPAPLVLFFIIPLYVTLFFFPHLSVFKSVNVGLVYFDGRMFWYGLWYLLALYCGCLLPLTPKKTRKITNEEIHLTLDIVSALAIVGYLYLYRSLLLHPGELIAIFSSGGDSSIAVAVSGHVKVESGQPGGNGGLNSFAQLGLVYFTIFFFTLSMRGLGAVKKRHQILFAILVGMTLFRAMFLAERLALIEFGVPAVLYFVHNRVKRAAQTEALLFALFPIVAMVLLVILFAATEYLRTWFYYQDRGVDFWSFIFGRMLTYYYASVNNGAMMLKTSEWPTFSMYFTMGWLYKFPFIAPVLIKLLGQKYYLYEAQLSLYANPEFNNTSGIFPIIHDLGVPGAMLFMFCLGGWLSFLYRSFAIGLGWGAFYYPLVYLTIIEILRIFYLSTSKLIVQVVLLWILSLLVRNVVLHMNVRKARRLGETGTRPEAQPAANVLSTPS